MAQTALKPVESASKKSVLVTLATKYGMEPANFEATLRATVVPEKCSKEQLAAFLLVAHEYDLNPVLKEIYAFPTKAGGIQPIVGVDGWMSLINRQPAMDGMTFEDCLDDKGLLLSVTCRIYRKDRKHSTDVTEYMRECKRPTEPWKQWPGRMLRHKAAIQCARYAFGFSGIVEPDEFERSPEARDITPPPPPPPPAPVAETTKTIDKQPAPPIELEPIDPDHYLDHFEAALSELGPDDLEAYELLAAEFYEIGGSLFPPDHDKIEAMFDAAEKRLSK